MIDETGRHERPQDRRERLPSCHGGTAGPGGSTSSSTTTCSTSRRRSRACLTALKQRVWWKGATIERRIRNAQGDMATVSGSMDAALVEGADLLITFSTPTLQAALRRTKTVPIVFTYLASAVAAGAGKSDTDHLPNVTGVYMAGELRQDDRGRSGSLAVGQTPGDALRAGRSEQVFHRERMLEATKKAGYEIRRRSGQHGRGSSRCGRVADVGMTSTPSVQIPGNLTAAAFPSLAQAARRARHAGVRVSDEPDSAGRVVAVARDYHDSGVQSAQMAARVMRGEKPGNYSVPAGWRHQARGQPRPPPRPSASPFLPRSSNAPTERIGQ